MADFARRMAELNKKEQSNSSTTQPEGGRQQQAGHDAYYGGPSRGTDLRKSKQQHSIPARQQRNYTEDLVHSHEYGMSHMRRASAHQPSAGRMQQKLYEKNYREVKGHHNQQMLQVQNGQSQASSEQEPRVQQEHQLAKQIRPRSPAEEDEYRRLSNEEYDNPRALPAAGSPTDSSRLATRKAQLREQYERRMHNDPHREIFACTMNNKQPGSILRSGIVSVLPRNGGPKKVHVWAARTPDRAGGLPQKVIEHGGDASLQWRPHEKKVKPHYEPTHAGQSSEKIAQHRLGRGRRQQSPEMQKRIYKHFDRSKNTGTHSDTLVDGNMGNFPWNSPEAELVRNPTLKSVKAPGSDHTYDIIKPDSYDPISAIIDPASKPKAPVWAEEHGSLSGKRCTYGAEYRARINPLDTQSRVFGSPTIDGEEDQSDYSQTHQKMRHHAEYSLKQRQERFGF